MRRPVIALEFLIALATVAAIGVGDTLTDTRVSLGFFHLLPIGLIAWRRGWIPGLAVAIAAGLTCATVDWTTHVLAEDGAFIVAWRSLDRLFVYFGAVYLLWRVRVLYDKAETLSRVDGLTGLLNRRTFDATCEAELRRCQRLALPLSVAVIDLDGFKNVNDGLGHAAGDAVLKAVGRGLATVRSGEISARLGGDEFAVLFPGSNREVARLAMDRVLAAVTEELRADKWAVTCSVGLASYERIFPLAEQLLHEADSAMYAAKKAKARVQLASARPPVGHSPLFTL